MTLQEWDALYQNPPAKSMRLFFSDGTVICNDKIISESLQLEESLCSERNLYYGRCESTCLKIRVIENQKVFKGLYVDVEQQIEGSDYVFGTELDNYIVDDQDNYLLYTETFKSKYGRFRVVSDVPTNDRSQRDLTCYDKMYDILNANVVDWYNSLEFPMTIKDLRDSFFEYLEIAQVDKELINDDLVVQKGFDSGFELSGKIIIESICEINGAFGHMNRAGEFDYITLPTGESITPAYYVNNSGQYEDYITKPITGINAIASTGDIGTKIGTDDNLYIIQANPLLFGLEDTPELTTALENLLDQIKDFTYRPFAVTTYGNPMLPLGTAITIESTYKTINSFVMSRTLTGIQSMKDRIEAVGEESYPTDVNNMQSQINRTIGMSHTFVNDINTLRSTIADFEEDVESEISQMADEIVLKVDNNGNIVKAELSADPQEGTSFNLNADNIRFVANTTLDLVTSQLNVDSNYFKLTSQGKMTVQDATFKGSVDATTMLFWDTLQAYSQYGQYTYDFAKFMWQMGDENWMTIKRPYGQGGTEAIRLNGPVQSDDYAGVLYGNWYVTGSFRVGGTKPRLVETEHYGKRILYSYETASPMFGDLGDGEIAEDGKCYVWLDRIFAETITAKGYQVFLQKCGEGDCWVAERTENYFVVQGTPGLSFCWELKAKQTDYDQRRLESERQYRDVISPDYGEAAAEHIEFINKEREVV